MNAMIANVKNYRSLLQKSPIKETYVKYEFSLQMHSHLHSYVTNKWMHTYTDCLACCFKESNGIPAWLQPLTYCFAVFCSGLQCLALSCGALNLQCVAACCSVLQCLAVSCSVLQCLAVSHCLVVYYSCCSVLQYVAVCCSVLQCLIRARSRKKSPCECKHWICGSVLHCVALCCSVMLYVALCKVSVHWMCCSVLQCVAVWCSVLQCDAICCSVYSVCYREQFLVLEQWSGP